METIGILTTTTALFALFVNVNCASVYNVTKVDYGAFYGELNIPISAAIASGWEAELTFDDKVILHIYEKATVKSNTGEKVFVVTNDAQTQSLPVGSFLLKFTANYDGNAGANLIAAKFQGKALDIGPVPVHYVPTIPTIGSAGNYNYNTVLHASLLFYEAQRSGKLPADNRLPWRGDSMLNDKGENGEDLTGGYSDAGDFVKFGLPMAYTVTVISWGVIDYEDAYTKAGELENVRKMIKWGTDYFLKAHVKEKELYGQVGDGSEDHASWGRPEDWPASKKRPASKITASAPGSELAGETAAALAAASIVFKKSDATYSATLLTHAKQLYKFANENRAKYSDSIKGVQGFYSSFSGYGDELGWAAAWLLRATNDTSYLTDFEKHWTEFKLDALKAPGTQVDGFFWDDKTHGIQVLIAKLTGDAKYKSVAESYMNYLVNDAKKSPKGMLFAAEKWGPLRHSSNSALLLLQAADIGINTVANRAFAKKQIDYALGDTGRSFVVGVGVNPPQRVHHRAASCPTPPAGCDHFAFAAPTPNPQILTGALVGGPDETDSYVDARDDYVHNEVACDYNAGFQSAVAALAHLKNSGYF